MPTTLTARRLITHDNVIDFPVLTLSDNGTIASIETDAQALANETTTLTAAYLDIHTHGALGHDVMSASSSDLAQMQRFLAQHGVAHYLPTTVTASIDTTLRALEQLANLIESPLREQEARPIGIHLEGPFLSHEKRGVHPADLLQPPSIELFDRFQQAARNHILLVTIAPEPGAPGPDSRARASAPPQYAVLDLIQHCAQQNVRVSVGHSNATAAETLVAIAAGATSATHTFNAMRPLDHREPGILGTALTDDHLYAELICDGIHVNPAMVQLWLRAKGPSRAILVTDAMPAAGMPDGAYTLGGLAVQVANHRALLLDDLNAGKETLAGSLLTMDRAVANLHTFTTANLEHATRAASHNPAAMLAQAHLTTITKGAPANLNRLDDSGNLLETYLQGKHVLL